MTRISLRDWVLLMTMAPTLIIGVVLGAYFTFNRFSDIASYLGTQGANIVEPLAIMAADDIKTNNRAKLAALIDGIHRHNSPLVKSITIFTNDNQMLVTSNFNRDAQLLRLERGMTIPDHSAIEETENYVFIRTPVFDNVQEPQFSDKLGYITIQLNKQQALLMQQDSILQSIFIILIALGVSVFFTIRTLRAVTFPVTSMINTLDKIREGKLDARVSGNLVGELNLLKNGINAIARSLGEYQNEMHRNIDQATSDLRETLEQMEIQNIELDIAKRKAQEANRVKSEFLANMSHELRTPLNGVIGFTRQLLKTPLSDNQNDYLGTIDKSANNLLSIINDILDFSKLDAGRMLLENIPFSLRDTADEALTLMAPIAHEKGLDLSIRIAPNTPNGLIGDPTRLKQVMINLIGNAIKFTSRGSVCIDIKQERVIDGKPELKITVTDTGIGISKEQQATLFEAFGQGDSSVTRRYGGTGLGLVIAKRLVNAMDGDLHMKSELKQGSVFWFTIICKESEIDLSESFDSSVLKNKTLIYLEQHEHTRVATAEILNRWGIQATVISDINAVSQLQDNQHFDIALFGTSVNPSNIADTKLLCKKLQLHCDYLHLLINSTSPNLREALIGSGAHTCQTKPLSLYKLGKSLAKPYLRDSDIVSTSASPSLIPVKVLAVDDNEANLKLIHAFLNEQVKEIKTATNGRDALELCNHEVFDLIFMDIQMPVMDGITARQRISEDSLNETTPIIAVTAHAMAGEKEKLLQQGFNAYLTKPLDEEMLQDTIYEYCATVTNSQRKYENKVLELYSPPENNNAIDWQLALNRAGGKENLAKEMLNMLADSLLESKKDIENAFENSDHADALAKVHKLHGACCYTGVPKLKQAAEMLETRLKENSNIQDLAPEFFELYDNIDNVLAEHASLLKGSTEPAH